jgi:integrase
MAIIKAPLASDPPGKCSRWRCVLYVKGKQEWTTHPSRGAAQAYERAQRERVRSGAFIAKADKVTVRQLYERFMADRKARGKRTSTIAWYETIAKTHLLAPVHGLADREVTTVRPDDFGRLFEHMLAHSCSASSVNRVLVMGRALFRFAIKRRLAELHPLAGFERYAPTADDPGRKVSRGAYSESEVQALMAAARPHERALIGLLCFTGLRPAEAYALDWSALDLVAGCLSVLRSWDYRGGKFVEPKTAAGVRVVPLSGWLVAELTAHRERTGGSGLVFANAVGKPFNPSNLRRDIWLPLKKRAAVRDLDLYSLRHSFASLARTAGESAFNVSRMMGHSRSQLVDQVYAHTMQSGMASVAENVTARALGTKPQLRVIEGGKAPDVRETLENQVAEPTDSKATA